MIIILLIIALLTLLLIDLPTIRKGGNKLASSVYFLLMFIGFSIAIIVVLDLSVPSPAIIIEHIIKSILER